MANLIHRKSFGEKLNGQQERNMKNICIKNLEAINRVIDYILYAEMGGRIDKDDPWYSTYENLQELREKMTDDLEGEESITKRQVKAYEEAYKNEE